MCEKDSFVEKDDDINFVPWVQDPDVISNMQDNFRITEDSTVASIGMMCNPNMMQPMDMMCNPNMLQQPMDMMCPSNNMMQHMHMMCNPNMMMCPMHMMGNPNMLNPMMGPPCNIPPKMDNKIPTHDPCAKGCREIDHVNYSDDFRSKDKDVEKILRKIECNNPMIMKTLMCYNMPCNLARNIMKDIIKLTLTYK
ncbi:hypothetical protein LGK99_09635 [Clostridium algidicarnis]|uniref:hypothetical protein n=1 Tax=Clostridium algidicarnis TaxID=37659 RepID=UPI001C0CB133|nr:hypothetical protein [Clostridium algidicarnis]MBU3194588.1 hypothetical protein [Clostridium algidicarnis]MCB2287349.1 hypothetical protein [Clostridium algidicarnis]